MIRFIRNGRAYSGAIIARSVCADGATLIYVRVGRWVTGVSRHNATDIAEGTS